MGNDSTITCVPATQYTVCGNSVRTNPNESRNISKLAQIKTNDQIHINMHLYEKELTKKTINTETTILVRDIVGNNHRCS